MGDAGADLVLDGLGMIPLVGNIADLANAGLYAYEGDYAMAALSAAAAIPLVGYGAVAAKYGAKGIKLAKAGRYAKLGWRGAVARGLDMAVTAGMSGYALQQGIKNGNGLQVGLGVLGLGTVGRTVGKGIGKNINHGVAGAVRKGNFGWAARKFLSNAGRQLTGRKLYCFVAGTPVLIPNDGLQASTFVASTHPTLSFDHYDRDSIRLVALTIGISGLVLLRRNEKKKTKNTESDFESDFLDHFRPGRVFDEVEFGI